MGCQITKVHCERVGTPIAYCKRIGTVSVDCERVPTSIDVTCSVVCEAGIGDFVRFALDCLQWTSKETNITKYNTLTASGAWSLEEVEIEELL